MKDDQLLEIFYRHLQKAGKIENTEDFTHNVVADYLFYLMNLGHIPAKALDALELDLKEEVAELYQKIQMSPIKNVLFKRKPQPNPASQTKGRRIN